jgi:CBS domain-containing protein
MYEFIYYRAAHAMTPTPVTVTARATLADAEALFERHDFNGLPVVGDDGRLAGLLTKLDLLRAFVFTPDSVVPHYDEIMRRPVESVMTHEPRTVAPDTPLTRVLEELVETNWKSLPVVEGDRLVGMIAREDILRALRRAAAGERPPE